MVVEACKGVMNVGHQLDDLATVISFPVSDVESEYGTGGTYYVRIQRNGDVAAYPTSNFSVSNGKLNLILTASDMAVNGEGQIQLRYTVGSVTKMSRIYKFFSHYSLDASAEVPDPWVSWVEAVEDNADRAEAAVAHYPHVDETTGNWVVWDVEAEEWSDTGIHAEGRDGEDGEDGTDGVTFTPSVSDEGVISWTNDGGRENPDPKNIRGPAGASDWDDIANKPSTFPPSPHNHDDRYYTESEVDDKVAELQPKMDNSLSTEDKNVVGAINEVKDAIDEEISARGDADDILQDEIDNLKAIGRFLSIWNCITGLPTTNPQTSPYQYKTGDYYLVGVVGATNYKPNGSSFTIGVASTTVESEDVAVSDYYAYDGTVWKLLKNTQKVLSFANITGNPSDNQALNTALEGKVGFTDYAKSDKAGAVVADENYGFGVVASNGRPFASDYTLAQFAQKSGNTFVSKTTLENIGDDFVSRHKGGLIDNSNLANGVSINASNQLQCAWQSFQTYLSLAGAYFISKGTLENVLTGKNINDVANETWTFKLSNGTTVTKSMKVGS